MTHRRCAALAMKFAIVAAIGSSGLAGASAGGSRDGAENIASAGPVQLAQLDWIYECTTNTTPRLFYLVRPGQHRGFRQCYAAGFSLTEAYQSVCRSIGLGITTPADWPQYLNATPEYGISIPAC